MEHSKTSTSGLAEIAKSKGLGEKLEAMIVISCSQFHHTKVQKAISLLQEPLMKARVNLK